MIFRFAEQFGVNPDSVASTVTVETWQRWLALEKARAARAAFDRQEAQGKLTDNEKQLIKWALVKEAENDGE